MKLALRQFGQPQWGTTAAKHNSFNATHAAKEALLAWLERLAQSFVQRLMADAAPRVWHTCDAEGNLWWHAHDPVIGRSLYDASEAELRIWIEQRHYPTRVD